LNILGCFFGDKSIKLKCFDLYFVLLFILAKLKIIHMMYRICLSLCLLFFVVACNQSASTDQAEAENTDPTTEVSTDNEEEVKGLAKEQVELRAQMEAIEEELSRRLSELKGQTDSVSTEMKAELMGKIKKLEVREKQLAQHIRKFEDGIGGGDLKTLNERFQALIEDIKTDLEATK
jgi:TolA-binding protein